MKEILYLVCGGGGVGICVFPGAFEQLAREPGFSREKIKAVGGCSAGSIAALLFSMNLTPKEIYDKLMSIDFKKMEDKSMLGKVRNLWRCFAMYKGDLLAHCVKEFISYKILQHRNQLFPITPGMIHDYKKRADHDPSLRQEFYNLMDAYNKQPQPSKELQRIYNKIDMPAQVTFADLKTLGCKDLHILTTQYFKYGDETKSKKKILSTENAYNTSVLLAIKASCAAPIYLQGIRLLKISPGTYVESKKGHVYVDGGISLHFPITMFDKDTPNDNVLGLGIYHKNKEKLSREKVILKDYNPRDFILAGLHALQDNNVSTVLCETDDRAAMISNEGISPFNFRITRDQKESLVEAGRRDVHNHFQRLYENEAKAEVTPERREGNFWTRSDVTQEQEVEQPEHTCIIS